MIDPPTTMNDDQIINPRPRPQLGEETIREIRVNVCAVCRYAIATGMCSYGCSLDGVVRRQPDQHFIAVYKRVDTFLRDETPPPPPPPPPLQFEGGESGEESGE